MRAMQPVFYEPPALRLNAGAFALRDFILVMRKHQVFTAQMEIETGSEQFHAHGAALDMPAGPAFAPGTGPEHRAVFWSACLPEREIRHGFLLVFITAHPLADAHLLEVQLHQLPVSAASAAILFNAKINRTVGRFIR